MTTGKVERFHKTIKMECLAGKTFESLEEAQADIDGWVAEYNTVKPHQGIGMVPPVRRFELAVSEPFDVAATDDVSPDTSQVVTERRVTRRVGQGGRISLATYQVSRGPVADRRDRRCGYR